ncbi:hypothetical protein Zm00014a_028073 [Zea mays]|uniref:Uncharacterized protein n=1 Tax=Zea mays TaxID=4577 RepID=A0A3L6EMM3_MAIZE|nr:hypothetical protein Zm00014a_028073 [Zea mays]
MSTLDSLFLLNIMMCSVQEKK